MPSPLDQAAETLAPAPPTTSFFGEPSNIARYYAGRQDQQAAEQMLDTTARLGRSRWDRAMQRRQLEKWGREDEEYQAQKDFEVQRGDFLNGLVELDPLAEDYEAKRGQILSSLPAQAKMDDATRAIFAAKDRVFENHMRDEDYRQHAEIRAQQEAKKQLEMARKDYVTAGGDPNTAQSINDARTLWFEAGKMGRTNKRAEKEEDAARSLARSKELADYKAKLTGLTGSDRNEFRRLSSLATDPRAFPEASSEKGSDRLSELVAAAARFPDKNQWINNKTYPEDPDPNTVGEIDDYEREMRGQVWDLAQRIKTGGQPPAAPAAPAPATPAAAEPTPAAPPAAAPKSATVDGVEYFFIDGKWKRKIGP